MLTGEGIWADLHGREGNGKIGEGEVSIGGGQLGRVGLSSHSQEGHHKVGKGKAIVLAREGKSS